jgi:hypothetical protein
LDDKENPAPQPVDTARTDEGVLEHSEDEVFKSFLSSYGVIIAFVVIVVVSILGIGKMQEEEQDDIREVASSHMSKILASMKEDSPEETRKKCDALINDPEVQGSPLSHYAAFLKLRTYVIEAQSKTAATGEGPKATLKRVNDFINLYSLKQSAAEREVLNFAYLAKACLLEDDGQTKEAGVIYAQMLEANSMAKVLSNSFTSNADREKRDELWNKHLKATSKP